VRPAQAALSHMPFVHLTDSDARKAQHGMEVEHEGGWAEGTAVLLCNQNGDVLAIGDYKADKQRLHPRVVIAPLE
jgi:hypothetical protein